MIKNTFNFRLFPSKGWQMSSVVTDLLQYLLPRDYSTASSVPDKLVSHADLNTVAFFCLKY